MKFEGERVHNVECVTSDNLKFDDSHFRVYLISSGALTVNLWTAALRVGSSVRYCSTI